MSLVVSLLCLAENLELIMGEETSVKSPRKTSLGHVRVVKQLITVVLDLKRWRVDPEAFKYRLIAGSHREGHNSFALFSPRKYVASLFLR